MELREVVAKTVCALEGSGGFCDCVGGSLGCKNGRGEQKLSQGCIASDAQLHLSGNSERADKILEVIAAFPTSTLSASDGAAHG